MKKKIKLLIALILVLFTTIQFSSVVSADTHTLVFNMDFDDIRYDGYDYHFYDQSTNTMILYIEPVKLINGVKDYGVDLYRSRSTMYIISNGIFGDNLKDFSYSMWVKNYGLYEEYDRGVVVSLMSCFELYFDKNDYFNAQFLCTDNKNANVEDYTVTSADKLALDEWYYITVTYSDGNLCLYINGKLSASKTVDETENYMVWGGNPYFGGSETGEYFKGAMDEVTNYTNAFTAAEAEEQYRKALTEATFTDHVSYPVDKTVELTSASDELWFETNRIYPLDTDYENPVSKDYYTDASLTDKAHTGKFALHINYSSTDYQPLVKCVPFNISEGVSTASETQSADTTNVSTSEMISGETVEVMGTTNYPTVEEDVVLESLKVNGVEEKLNIVSLWVCPGKNAKCITFYLKTDNGEYLSAVEDNFYFELGEDFSLGEWQEFKLDLTKVETASKITGLYMTANDGSEWSFDTVRSEYRHIDTQEFNLRRAVSGNLIFATGSGLQFDRAEFDYNTAPVITNFYLETTDKIHSLDTTIDFVSLADDTNSDETLSFVTNSIKQYADVYISQNGRFVYYINNAGQLVYVKIDDVGTQTAVLDSTYSYDEFAMSQNGEHIYCEDGEGSYDNEENVYNYTAAKKDFTYDKYVSNSGNVYTYNTSTDRFTGTDCEQATTRLEGAVFSDNDEYIFLYQTSSAYESYILKKSGDEYIIYQTLDINVNSTPFFDKTGEHIYYSNYCIDVETGVSYLLDITGTAICNYKDDKVLYQSGTKYIVYDPISNEKEVITIVPYTNDVIVRYNKYIEGFVYYDGTKIGVCSMLTNSSAIKFLLSFNESNVWYTYDNGFKVVSYGEAPTHQTYMEHGMTAEQMAAIPFDKFEEFQKTQNIMSVKIGMRVSSASTLVSPIIKSVRINTVPNDSAEYLYAARIAKFDKDNYSSINSAFPTETFADETEAYYYFYLGNDWLYTFRNNKLSLVGKSADDLFGDVESNWMYIKYTGMSLGEIRSLSIDELNSLFLNPDYANTEFGIISVLRTKGNKTEDAKVEFKFNMNEKHLSGEGSYVAEILMNNGTTVSFTSEDAGNDAIESFLVWFANVQMGNGSEFYCLKTATGIRYVNYRLIIGVNIYEAPETTDIADDENVSLSDGEITNVDLPDGEIIETGDNLLPDVLGEEDV